MTFKDHFSGHADRYRAYRPTYPSDLFDYLASLVAGRDLAWDCATGNGQAALGLTPHFRRVVATDASDAQLSQARPHDRIDYLVCPAERTPLPGASVDLVTVAQAFHWLELPQFYDEVRRVCRPGAVLACWCYQLNEVDPQVDAVVRRYYGEVVGPYRPPERLLVEAGYRTLTFPFEELTPPSFRMTLRWDLRRVMGYLGTWSSSQRYRADRGRDPLDEVREALADAWGDEERERSVSWPLHMRIGRVGTPGGFWVPQDMAGLRLRSAEPEAEPSKIPSCPIRAHDSRTT
jgi:ubiquinone/menaquinone biosynthesis C-methylase UbiE